MADTVTGTALEPLRALRYDAERFSLDEVVAPPYDVISPADREALLRRNDHNVVRLELPDTAQTAAQRLHEWRRDGALVRDAEPALWWHEQRFTGPDGVDRSRAGFFSAVRLSPYEEGRVRPHERTHAPGRGGWTCSAPPVPTPRRSSRSTTTRTDGRARRWHPPPIARPTCRPRTATTPSTASGASRERRRSRPRRRPWATARS